MAAEAEFPRIICRVKALYAFNSKEKSSLSFEKDEYIDVLSQLDTGWWDGLCKGSRGWFPSNFVKIVDPEEGQEEEQIQPRQQESDGEEERAIEILQNMNKQNNRISLFVTSNTRPHSLALEQPPVNIVQPTNTNKALNKELPEGWTLQIADDGVTEFYYNQHTGGLRWNHPSLLDSDEEEEELSSTEGKSEEQHTYNEYHDFGKKEQHQQQQQQLRQRQQLQQLQVQHQQQQQYKSPITTNHTNVKLNHIHSLLYVLKLSYYSYCLTGLNEQHPKERYIMQTLSHKKQRGIMATLIK